MAKKYSLRNVANPARPIGLMVKNTDVADGSGFRYIKPDVPTILDEDQYETCKKAVDMYVKSGDLSLKILNTEKTEKSESEKDLKDKIVKEAKELFGVDLVVGRKGLKTLEAELYALKADAETEASE